MNYTPDGSLITARQNAPVFLIITGLLILAVLIFLIWIVSRAISKYKTSPEYQEKQKSRPTTFKDIKFLKNEYKIPNEESDLLFEICQLMNLPNIVYLIKDNLKMQEIFKSAYFKLQASGCDSKKLNLLFKLNYFTEIISAQSKKLISTKQIPVSTIVFYVSETNEQFPFTVLENTNDYFLLEVPNFFFNLDNRPDLLNRVRFTFKSQNGLSHNFISRITRYQKNPDGTTVIFVSHTEKLITETHRHFRRETFDCDCKFSSAQKIQKNDGSIGFKISEKKYAGKISNISGGGCCIKTNLPIQEKQYIALFLSQIAEGLSVTGLIRGTRKLPTGEFALHIQFLELPIEAQNKIFEFVYKYKL